MRTRPSSPRRARSAPTSRWRADSSAHCQGGAALAHGRRLRSRLRQPQPQPAGRREASRGGAARTLTGQDAAALKEQLARQSPGDRPRGRPRSRPRKSPAADAPAALPAADVPCAAPRRGQRREKWASGTFAASARGAKRPADDRAVPQTWKRGIWARGTLSSSSSAATGKAAAAGSQAAVTLPVKVDLCGADASKGGDQKQKEEGASEVLPGECSAAILPPKGGGWQWLLQFRAHHAKADAKGARPARRRTAAGAGRPLRPAAAVVCVGSAAGPPGVGALRADFSAAEEAAASLSPRRSTCR